jgi:hypothetical protein
MQTLGDVAMGPPVTEEPMEDIEEIFMTASEAGKRRWKHRSVSDWALYNN